MNLSSAVSDSLTRFWEIEQVSVKKFLSKEEQACESHFCENVKRTASGRYIVNLPFNENKDRLRGSYDIALKRFYSLENKLSKNQTLKESYSGFMKGYMDIGHMSLDQDPESNTTGFFLPHHAVIKEDSLSTTIRMFLTVRQKV